MDFSQFLNLIPKIIESSLTGAISHDKMAPLERKKIMEDFDFDSNNHRKAAILMLVYPKNDIAHLVLIVRNSYSGVHSSQIAFPGGKVDPVDKSFLETALRETFEEIGISPNEINVIRSFSEIFIPPSNFLVYPFLGFSTQNLSFIPDPKEVATIIECPLSELLNDENKILKRMATSYSKNIEVPAYQVNEHIVWGATAMILSELKDVLDAINL